MKKIKCKDCNCFLEYESVRDYLIKYKFLSCNKDYSNKIDEKLKKQFKSTFKFSNNNNNNNNNNKEEFYSHLNLEDMTDVDNMHTKSL